MIQILPLSLGGIKILGLSATPLYIHNAEGKALIFDQDSIVINGRNTSLGTFGYVINVSEVTTPLGPWTPESLCDKLNSAPYFFNQGGLPGVSPYVRYINQLTDFPAPIDNKIYLEDRTAYIITTEINTGLNEIIFGENSSIRGKTPSISKLIHEGTSDFIVGSGDIWISSITIETPNSIAGVFNLNDSVNGGFSAVEMYSVNFNNCLSLGVITNYRQMLMSSCGFFGCTDGFTAAGTWLGGWKLDNSIVLFSQGNFTLLRCEVGQTFGSRLFYNSSQITLATGQTGLEVSPLTLPEQERCEITNCKFFGAGTPVSGIEYDNIKSLFLGNTGLRDTIASAAWYTNDNAVPTTIASAGVPVKMDAPTISSRSVLFSHTSPNTITYNSNRVRPVIVSIDISMVSGNNNVLAVYIYKNSSPIQGARSKSTSSGAGRAENISVNAAIDVELGDVIEVYIENLSAANDIIVEEAHLIIS